jgi:ribosomal-protein-alanine N-acetyltransferase
MPPAPTLSTARLVLRPWRPSDRAPFAALSADPRVMRFLGPLLTRAQSDGLADRIEAHFAEHGFGLWAVEAPGVVDFAGFVGLAHARFQAPFNPSIEIGWRLGAQHWGRGYATEAAREAARFAFEELSLREILAFTTRSNAASRAVMERLRMTHDPRDDFEHPALAPGDPLRPHVLYRLSHARWLSLR